MRRVQTAAIVSLALASAAWGQGRRYGAAAPLQDAKPGQPRNAVALTSGVPATLSLAPVQVPTIYNGPYSRTIEVPINSTELRIALRSLTGADTDLFVRYGQDIDLDSNGPIADFMELNDGGNETLTLRPPTLRPGVYFIAAGLFSTGVPATITITATVTPEPGTGSGGGSGPSAAVVSQFVGGGGEWDTSLYLTNLGNAPEDFTVAFHDGFGAPKQMPIDGMGMVSSLTGTLDGGATRVFQTGPASTLQQGWALITPGTPGSQRLSGFAIFRQQPLDGPPSEAIVPFAGPEVKRYLLVYDNSPGFATGVALANPNPDTELTVTAETRDEAGQRLSIEAFIIPPNGQLVFVLSQRLPDTAGRRGSVLFSSSPLGFAGLGLRFSSTGTFTSFPLVTSAEIQ